MTVAFLKFPLQNSLGGAEFQTLAVASGLKRAGYDIRLFTSDEKLYELFARHDLPCQKLFVGWEPTSKLALLFWPLTFFLARRQLKKVLDKLPAGSALFFQSLTEKLILTRPARRRGFQVFWLEHKVPGRWLLLNPLQRRYLKLAPMVRVLTVSNFAKQEFLRLGIPGANLEVIYPGVATPPVLACTAHPFTIGILSRLDPEKGVKEFLRAVRPALARHPDWQIQIAGAGSATSQIQALIVNPPWQNQVRALGLITDRGKFFSEISVLVYPSLVSESFGLAAAEAQAHGVPVVAFAQGALPEIVEHQKTGFLAPPKDFAAMFQDLEKLSQPQLWGQMAAAARATQAKFEQEKMIRSFKVLLKS